MKQITIAFIENEKLNFLLVEPTLEEYQRLVGGHIEMILTASGLGVINEEGKLLDLPYNNFGTLFFHGFPISVNPEHDDYIAGPLIITNEDEEGEFTTLSAESIEKIKRNFKFCKLALI